ncbi:hypothetical protein HYALB_00008392 [Hymenoscyphus albidus]|uniref:Uncharacterized protein n=1 Tax=Hymenoscyphus albidus TaxID=595503 RepID=A0A9N9LKX4_9HELO|nr:hypothetical protein HYALB_00008392 [Hymenoscyphus albidus]
MQAALEGLHRDGVVTFKSPVHLALVGHVNSYLDKMQGLWGICIPLGFANADMGEGMCFWDLWQRTMNIFICFMVMSPFCFPLDCERVGSTDRTGTFLVVII